VLGPSNYRLQWSAQLQAVHSSGWHGETLTSCAQRLREKIRPCCGCCVQGAIGWDHAPGPNKQMLPPARHIYYPPRRPTPGTSHYTAILALPYTDAMMISKCVQLELLHPIMRAAGPPATCAGPQTLPCLPYHNLVHELMALLPAAAGCLCCLLCHPAPASQLASIVYSMSCHAAARGIACPLPPHLLLPPPMPAPQALVAAASVGPS
jgi:hypothetical protein